MKATILLINDYPGFGESLSHTLRLEGYSVTLASNGREALDPLRVTGFDLVLLDLDMSVTNGWDTLGQIVTVSLSLPFIVIMERSDRHDLTLQQGVAAVLEKPLDTNFLLNVIERVLAEKTDARRQRTERSI
jgi:DNA-binding NtrC family response regulator